MVARVASPLFLVGCWTLLAGLLAINIRWANRGFGWGDESYTLLAYRFPQATPPDVRQFQFVTEALTLHRQLSIAQYRVMGLALLVLGSMVLAQAVLYYLGRRVPQFRAMLPTRSSVLAFVAVGGLMAIGWGARTPGYSTYSAVFAELAVAAILCAAAREPVDEWTFEVAPIGLAAVAGVLNVVLLFNRFPSALVVTVSATLFLFAVLRWRQAVELLLAMVGGALLGLVVLTTDLWGGPFSLAGLREGVSLASSESHVPNKILGTYAGGLASSGLLSIPAVLFALVFVAPFLARRLAPAPRIAARWILTVPAMLAFAYFVRNYWDDNTLEGFFNLPYMVLGGMAYGLAGVHLVRRVDRSRSGDVPPPSRPPWLSTGSEPVVVGSLALLLIGFVISTSFGTNVDLFFVSMTGGSGLALLALLAWSSRGYVLDVNLQRSVLGYVPLALAVALFAMVVVHGTVARPYGINGTLASQTQMVDGLDGLSGIHLDPATAEVLSKIQREVHRVSPYQPGQPVVVGQGYLGVAYAIGGFNPGSHWTEYRDEICRQYERVPLDMARTGLVLRPTDAPPLFDECLNRVLPGYPEEFENRATITGPYIKGTGGVDLQILVRRDR